MLQKSIRKPQGVRHCWSILRNEAGRAVGAGSWEAKGARKGAMTRSCGWQEPLKSCGVSENVLVAK